MSTEIHPVIRLENITLRREGREILSGINLSVLPKDFIAITGPNGGGKTTLLKIILRLQKPSAGKVEYFNDAGLPVADLPIGYLPQKNMIDSRFPITVEEVVASGLLAVKGIDASMRNNLVDQTLEQIELSSRRRQTIGTLSGGQLQRALLGRALISSPSILILDEPLSYIDKNFEKHLYDIISELASDTTILLVSHEMSVIADMANRHLIVNHTIHECHAHHHFIPSPCN